MVFRPATPGFLVTLAATGCLAAVSFSVPWLKSVYFLRATINQDGINGTATFGVLGYCFEAGGNSACSNATVGWEFNPNALFGINLPMNIDIPNVVVKWLTYVLVLHVVGLCLAAIAALFGLLAHVREMAMTCFSTCISGFAASIVLIAFIFDLIFFFLIRTRIRAVGGRADVGNAIWLTLASWLMLFFAGFFFGFGRCCVAGRPRGPKGWKPGKEDKTNGISHTEALRLEAVKAEAERKARQTEIGLPAFPTGAESLPLKKPGAQYYVEEDSEDETRPYHNNTAAQGLAGAPRRQGSVDTAYTTNYAGRGRQQPVQYAGGYVQGPPGTRSIDAYNNAGVGYPPANSSYPPTNAQLAPAPQRQASGNSSSNWSYHPGSTSPPPMPVAPGQPTAFLNPNAGDPYSGHGNHQTSYHSAVSHQQGQASSYSQYDQGREYGGASNDPYYGASSNQQPPGAYSAQDQPYGQTAYNQPAASYTNPFMQPPAPAVSPTPAPYGGYASNRPYSPPQAYGGQHYDTNQGYNSPGPYGASLPVGAAAPRPGTAPIDGQTGYQGQVQRSPTSPRGPVAAPWQGAAGSSTIPSEAPPGYDVPSTPGAYPKEKR